MLKTYSKSLVQLAGLLLAIVVPLISGDHSGVSVLNAIIAAAGVIAVWVSANLSTGIARYTKAILSVVTAALVVAASAYTDSVITNDEWKQIVVAAITSLVVLLKGNDGYRFARQRAVVGNPTHA